MPASPTMHPFVFTRKLSASNKTPRQINRNLVFNLIRRKQPVSRADLARVSGLQRSTISLIVEDLIRDRWVLDGAQGKLPRGRHPTYLELNHQRAVIALDVHPLQTTVAVIDLGGKIIDQNEVNLAEDPKRAITQIGSAIQNMIAAHSDKSFDGVGISLPGRADPRQQQAIFAPNLHWPVQSIRSQIHLATGLRVEMDNVANACALSEVWFGDSDGLEDVVAVNVSEGIGTGIFSNGRLLRGADGMAGEFGHIEMMHGGSLCGCGNRGCWETVASNSAGLRYYYELSGRRIQSFMALIRLAQSNDPVALQALEMMSVYLGRGLKMIASALAPDEIVIVGDITRVWSVFGPTIEKELSRNALAKAPRLRPSFDGNASRLRSAVALVMNQGVA